MNINASQGSRDRAVLLGVLRMFLKCLRRHIGDRRFRVEIDPLDGPSSVTLFEMDFRCCSAQAREPWRGNSISTEGRFDPFTVS